jgi:hypothetical protein
MHNLFLRLLLLSALAGAYNPSSIPQHQLALDNGPTINQFGQLWAYCPLNGHWKCYYSIIYTHVSCRCIGFITQAPPDTDKAESGAGDWGARGEATSLEVMAEIQPGNNETLISLFEMQCDENTHGGCVSKGAGGFLCGCHRWGEDEGAEERPLRRDYERNSELKIREYDGPELGESRLTEASHFPFQAFHFPHCNKPGYHVKCCSHGGKSQCFCAEDGVGCKQK